MLAEKAEFPVKLMARVLGVNRSGFYSWLSSGRPREGWSAEREAVRRVWLESDRRFGFRFVKRFLPGEFSGRTLYTLRSRCAMQRCHAAPRKHSAIARRSPSWASLVTHLTPETPRLRRSRQNPNHPA